MCYAINSVWFGFDVMFDILAEVSAGLGGSRRLVFYIFTYLFLDAVTWRSVDGHKHILAENMNRQTCSSSSEG